ncbi:Cyanovirin-N -like protein [Escovopsis weberi]|uniref:Cyanovirin-N-like protein n=1 Tax=Escovopsis weberi TaxID=150374 RepID=A0A0M9VTQ9_ESCWE|nr:Cyanovirin-N -like protein [Escovopsis weberi]
MSFAESSQNWRLEGSVLCAQVRRADGSWDDGRLDLNEYVGNNDGEIEIGGRDIYNSADMASWRLDGTTVITLLYKRDGSFGPEQFLPLDKYVSNENGVLAWRHVHPISNYLPRRDVEIEPC